MASMIDMDSEQTDLKFRATKAIKIKYMPSCYIVHRGRAYYRYSLCSRQTEGGRAWA